MATPLTAFTDAVTPYHSHMHCSGCKRTRRSGGSTGALTLARCMGCLLAQYCCQKTAWIRGHRDECKQWSAMRDIANNAAGYPRAWNEFARWREYHHDTLTNAVLSHIILNGDGSEDEHTLVVYLKHNDDPTLLIERKFRVTASRFVHMDQNDTDFYIDPVKPMIREMLLLRRIGLRHLRSGANGSQESRMATYMVITTFGTPDADGPGQARHVPYYRVFSYDTSNLGVRVLGPPEPALEVIINNGLKQRFCCGKLRSRSDCCCGGWTHELDQEIW
ncbi:unnamed protein product [Peniophora sp. CBMAI 1063]|nr:unnamed protein product [Peniophora sp. CBMAI 1063]